MSRNTSDVASDRDRIGRYLLRRRAGFGTQGIVYEAVDPELDRPVAIKLLDPDPQLSPDIMQAAHAEARAAARLDHPNIASIFDFGVHGARPYLVFQYVPGIGLETFLDGRGPVGEKDVWAIMEPVLHAIQHAHDAGIAHLDLKPHNIRVTPKGVPMVLDFGLARFYTRDSELCRSETGTPRYMSPEHIVGGELGPRADVFSLCLILYEILAGEPSRHVERWVQMGRVPMDEAIDLSPLAAHDVCGAALAVLRDGLAMDARSRIGGAGELHERLRTAWSPAPEQAPPGQHTVQFVIRRLKSRGDIPAFPRVVLDVNRMTSERSSATVSDLANVVLRDNALSTRLLRLANSAFHATRVKATRVSDAISRLGLEQVRVAANGMGYFGTMTGSRCLPRLREILLVSFASALVARHFALSLAIEKVEEAMLCGMLFNTGEHLVLHCLPEEHEEICAGIVGAGDVARLNASRDVLGVDYATLGAAVATTWHLPAEIVDAIGWRTADAATDDLDASLLPRIAAAANELCEGAASSSPGAAARFLDELAQRHDQVLHMSPEALSEVTRSMALKMRSFAPALGINPETSEYLCALARWLPEAEGEQGQVPGPRRRSA
jgi:serine/threonine protein kinase